MINIKTDEWDISKKNTWKYEITCNCGKVFIGTLLDICPKCKTHNAAYTNEIPQIQVNSATKNGFELASEGDSINFSMPKSKTRRGRVGVGVGVGVAQTLDTQVNQGVVLNQSPTLSGFEHGTNGQLDRQLLKGGMIRRLTEIECERLQGYKDNWTKYGNYDGVVKEISRTQRYKLCGNAVTVNVVELIGIKLLKT